MFSKMSNSLRFLAADIVQNANSGHPGMPMGLSDVMSVFSAFYRHNPKNPKLLSRDRLVFSGGHGSALVYSLLYLWGYDVSMQDLKNFRKFGSKTPGHPEFGETAGIEVTTGPLGQGFANAVGFAMAGLYANKLLGLSHKTYCFCGDGDLQEGISYEAASLAGHLGLKDLIVIYDKNKITIDGSTDLCFTEDINARFSAQNWQVISINGHDHQEIYNAFETAQKAQKPCLIIANTTIAKGSINLAGTAKSHGAPLGKDEILASKKALNLPSDEFFVPELVLERFRASIQKGELLEQEFEHFLNNLSADKKQTLNELLNPDFSSIVYPNFEKDIATRDSNYEILNAISTAIKGFLGGSADLAASNKTFLENNQDFPNGKNIRYGIREHAMGAISNAFANYGLFLPFNSTFFVFSDYQKPSVRVSALMSAKVFYIWTHDSIGVGEDGKTHQPIEQLSAFRALPNFYVFRPADGFENVESWRKALELNAPCGFVLTRQKTKKLSLQNAVGDVNKGAYLLKSFDTPSLTILASGSEVELALNTSIELEKEGIKANVASVPCLCLFKEQDKNYQEKIINPNTKVLAIEASKGDEWYEFADKTLTMKGFGASGDANDLFKHFGFSLENAKQFAKDLLGL